MTAILHVLPRYCTYVANGTLGISIRVKIMGIIIGVTALLGGVTTIFMVRSLRETSRDHLRSKAVWTARSVVEGGLDLVLTNDTITLHEYLTDLAREDEEIAYLLVLDEMGTPIAHTFPGPVPRELLRVRQASPDQPWDPLRRETEEGFVWDVEAPIMGGQAGSVRVGVTEDKARRALAGGIGSLLAITAAAAALALALSIWLTQILARRILHLVEITRAAGRGEFETRATISWNDEIGHLSRAFNEMIERLGRTRKELRRKEAMRVHLLRRVLKAQEEERRRVARELHDQTGQAITSLLVGMRLAAESATVEEARERIEEARVQGARTLDEVRNLAWELRPAVLDDHGLAAAIDRYVKHCGERYGFETDLCRTNRWPERLPPEMETALYRIIQEALTNVPRHADAGHVSLVLEHREGALLVIVEDDGCGFDVEEVMSDQDRPALGFIGMRERAMMAGGSLELESEPGRGTTVFVRLPWAASTEDMMDRPAGHGR